MTNRLRPLLARYAAQLAAAGIEQAEAELEWIFEHVLGVDRLRLYLEGDDLLTDAAAAQADAIVQRRLTRHPLQFILGEAWFYGRKFSVSEAVMAPTPETELLVETAVRSVGSRGLAAPRVLDVGVGSGVIAVTLALELPACRVTAVDISAEALAVAQQNAAAHGVRDRVDLRVSDFFSAVAADERFDLIVSNPPYIAEPDYAGLAPEVRADPKIAMTAGPEGLDAIRVLVQEAPAHLVPGGRLMFEIGHDQADKVAALTARDPRYRTFVLLRDLNDRDRVIILGGD